MKPYDLIQTKLNPSKPFSEINTQEEQKAHAHA